MSESADAIHAGATPAGKLWRRWLLASVAALVASALLQVELRAQTAAPAASQAAAAAVGPAAAPPADMFFKRADVLRALLSPSGQRLAITTDLAGGRVGLYVWDLAGAFESGTAPRITQAARFSDIDVANVQWANDEQLLFGLIEASQGSGQQEGPGLYVVRHDGQDLRELISPRFARVVQRTSSIRRESLHPNHRLLSVPRHGKGEEVLIGELIGVGGQLTGVQPLWLSLASGKTRGAAGDGPRGAVGWMFDGEGQARLAVVSERGRRQLHWRAPGQEEWRRLDKVDADAESPPFNPSFVGDDGSLYVTRVEGQGRWRVLTRFDFGSGRPDPNALVKVQGFDYSGVPVFGPPGGPLLGLNILADAETPVWFDERMKRAQQQADARFPGYIARLQCNRRCGQEDMVLLVHAYNDRDPGQLWLYRPHPPQRADGQPGASWRMVAQARRGLDPRAMGVMSLERIAARDGRELPVWLWLPPGHQRGQPAPAVVMVHGGPWVRGYSWRWHAMEQFLASRGYVVIAPEFRGSTGYGASHFMAGFRQWGQAMQDDLADAARWASRQGLADRFCIAGASYGGYATLMGLVRDADLYRCGVAWVAVADPLLYLEGSWWIDDDISSEGRRYSLPRRVGDPKNDEAMLKAASPVEQAARITRPLLLAYGSADRRVPIQHGERLRAAMRDAGREPLWVVYPGEGHSWLMTETHLDFARRFEAFLEEHLRPAAR